MGTALENRMDEFRLIGWRMAEAIYQLGQESAAADFARKKSSRKSKKATPGRSYTRGAGKKQAKPPSKSSDLKTKKSCSKGTACGRSCIAASKVCGGQTLKNTVRAAAEYLKRGTTTSGKKLSKADQRRIQELADNAQRQLDERSKAKAEVKSKAKPSPKPEPKPKKSSGIRDLQSSLIDIASTRAKSKSSDFNPDRLEEYAQSIAKLGGTVSPLVVRRTDDDGYEVVNGDFAFHAANRAYEINDNQEMIRAYIVDRDSEPLVLKQLELSRALADPPPGEPANPGTPRPGTIQDYPTA
jgi:hypothetical protein